MVVTILWISGNRFGYELLKEAMAIKDIFISSIFTLSKTTTTKMYDGIPLENWYSFGIPVIEVNNINEHTEKIQDINPDMIIVCGWRQIIGNKILSIPQKGVIGFHPTLLPIGRGPAPIINTILEGFTKSGITMYYLSDTLDGGDIIGQETFRIKKTDNAEDIYEKVISSGKILINKYLPKLVDGNAPRYSQDENNATYFPKRTLMDNEIHLGSDSPELISRKIRALSKPYNGAYIVVNNTKIPIRNISDIP
jgi:methionyl-tRNA formyltransferase